MSDAAGASFVLTAPEYIALCKYLDIPLLGLGILPRLWPIPLTDQWMGAQEDLDRGTRKFAKTLGSICKLSVGWGTESFGWWDLDVSQGPVCGSVNSYRKTVIIHSSAPDTY